MKLEDYEEHIGTVMDEDELADLLATRSPKHPRNKAAKNAYCYYGSPIQQLEASPEHWPLNQTINSKFSNLRSSVCSRRSLSQKSVLRRSGVFDKLNHGRQTDCARLGKKQEEMDMVRHNLRNLKMRVHCVTQGMRQERNRVLAASSLLRGRLKAYYFPDG